MALSSPLQALSPACEFLASSPRVCPHHRLSPVLPSQEKPDHTFREPSRNLSMVLKVLGSLLPALTIQF